MTYCYTALRNCQFLLRGLSYQKKPQSQTSIHFLVLHSWWSIFQLYHNLEILLFAHHQLERFSETIKLLSHFFEVWLEESFLYSDIRTKPAIKKYHGWSECGPMQPVDIWIYQLHELFGVFDRVGHWQQSMPKGGEICWG